MGVSLSCPRGGVAASVSPSPEGPADLLAVGHRDPCGSPGVLSQPGPWGTSFAFGRGGLKGLLSHGQQAEVPRAGVHLHLICMCPTAC